MDTYHINPPTGVSLRIAISTVAVLIALQLLSCGAKQDPTSITPIVTADTKPTDVGFGIEMNPATGSAWRAGDIVPTSIITAIDPAGTSDFWDVKARGYWLNGKWTIKFKRALTTASTAKDVQLSTRGSYPFAFAIHNNNAPEDHFGIANRSFKLNLMQ